MRYFELWFDGHPEECICIRGVREPTVEEANQFAKADVEQIGGEIYRVQELSLAEAEEFYDFRNVDKWPIFGKTTEHKENTMAKSVEKKVKTVEKKAKIRYFKLWIEMDVERCIRGVKQPTPEEATAFLQRSYGYTGKAVHVVEEISAAEAANFYPQVGDKDPIFDINETAKGDSMAKSEKKEEKTEEKKSEQKREMVNAPSHYCPNGVDSFMEYKDIVGPEPFKGFLQLNVMKYVQRYAFKGTPTQDLNKAFFYLAHLFFEMGGEESALEATLHHAAKHYQKG